MKLYKEVMEKAGLDGLVLSGRGHFEIGGGAYFEDVKSLSEYSKEKIVVSFQKGQVILTGEAFEIGQYGDGDLEVKGKIYGYAFEEKNGEK